MNRGLFLNLDLAAAISRAKDEKKLLLVDCTAAGNQACELMNATWEDAKVGAVLADRAIAIRIDVDADKDAARRLNVKRLPTVVGFRDGVELDRIDAIHGPGLFLEWFDCLVRGETALQGQRRLVRENPDNMEFRIHLASRLREAEAFDEATTEYLWLWKHLLERAPEMLSVKHSILLMQLEGLVNRHAPARAAFTAIRDALQTDADEDQLLDWCALNQVLGETEKTLAWFDERRDRLDPESIPRAIELHLEPLLIAAERWADVGRVLRDPVGKLRVAAAETNEVLARMEQEMPGPILEPIRAQMLGHLPVTASMYVRALRAAGRDEDVRKLAAAAVEIDASATMAAVFDPQKP